MTNPCNDVTAKISINELSKLDVKLSDDQTEEPLQCITLRGGCVLFRGDELVNELLRGVLGQDRFHVVHDTINEHQVIWYVTIMENRLVQGKRHRLRPLTNDVHESASSDIGKNVTIARGHQPEYLDEELNTSFLSKKLLEVPDSEADNLTPLWKQRQKYSADQAQG
jgi:hypothetical protein